MPRTVSAGEVVGLVFIFLSGFAGVMTPLGFQQGSTYLSYLNLVASGVLVAASLVHLLSDSAGDLESAPLAKTASGDPFPWAFVFFGLTFYTMFIFERIVLKIPHSHSHEHTRLIANQENEFTCQPEQRRKISSIHSGYHEDMVVRAANEGGLVSGIVLMCGLGFHSFLAGIGLGVAADGGAWTAILVAILCHKLLAAIAIGAAFHRAGTVKRHVHVILATVFGLITPFGAGMGILIGQFVSAWVAAIFLSIASGTFLYVAMYEIVLHEFENSENWTLMEDLKKCGAMLLGFGGMTLLANWT